jgi:hypothetical protein
MENNFVEKRKTVKVIRVKGVRADGGAEVWLHFFLTLILDGGQCLARRPGHFISEGKNPG